MRDKRLKEVAEKTLLVTQQIGKGYTGEKKRGEAEQLLGEEPDLKLRCALS